MNMKTGAPTNEVITPIGSSVGANNERERKSENIRNSPPTNML